MVPLWAFEVKFMAQRTLEGPDAYLLERGFFWSPEFRARSKLRLKAHTAVSLWLEVSELAGVPGKLHIFCYFILNRLTSARPWLLDNEELQSLGAVQVTLFCSFWCCRVIALDGAAALSLWKERRGSAWHCGPVFKLTSPLFILLNPLCLCLYAPAVWL